MEQDRERNGHFMTAQKTKISLGCVATILLAGSIGATIYISRKPVSKSVVVPVRHVRLEDISPDAEPPAQTDLDAAMKKCASNLRQLGLGMLMYANAQKDGSLPPDFATLLTTQDLAAKIFLDPRRGTSMPSGLEDIPLKDQALWINIYSDFIYFGAGKTNHLGSNEPMAMEKPLGLPAALNDTVVRVNILFGDGHVEAWPADRAIELMNKTLANGK
jgi:prepilin-type processing-associated H-X9-DG protein